ncbi:hypothetical protein GCM10010994_38020 [Chelatococcus reniformis]|uniref:DUF2243 domain-containing protein n=1 Tax=Chelatococcus reniformis TaxID=1494448 RepID=A0A916XIM8_9HYPH|nr:hypothetical protein GCM10010994_38020 [Chelatococcus reniformis]
MFVVIGLFILWRFAHRQHLVWSTKLLIGSVLLGFGTFNTVEGIVDHQILGVHHVNEQVSEAARFAWDMAFLAWGAVMIADGWLIMQRGKRDMASMAS